MERSRTGTEAYLTAELRMLRAVVSGMLYGAHPLAREAIRLAVEAAADEVPRGIRPDHPEYEAAAASQTSAASYWIHFLEESAKFGEKPPAPPPADP